MHPSALNFGKLFFETYCSGLQGAVVHDVGAQNVNGSLKDVLPPHLGYVGVDFVAGNGVDIVLEDPYRLPFGDGSLDVLVCSSCFEHSQFFWVVFLEMLRVLKPQGLLYLNVPSNGSVHRYPVDCWRFYPDAGRALEAWADRNGQPAQLLESFIGERSPDGYESGGAWHDYVAVFVNDRQHAGEYAKRMLDVLPTYSNGFDSRTGSESRAAFLSPDHSELVARGQAVAAMRQEQTAAAGQIASLLRLQEDSVRAAEDLRRQLSERDRAIALQSDQLMADRLASAERIASLQRLNNEATATADELQRLLAARDQRLVALQETHDARMDEILNSRSWRMTAPVRKVAGVARGVRSGASRMLSLGHAHTNTQQQDAALIRESGEFDEAFYRSANPGLPAGLDVVAHYCEHGWRERRDPSPAFSTGHYLDGNADIRAAGVNPLVHYIVAGRSEQRSPNPMAERLLQNAGGDGLRPELAAEVAAIRGSGMFDEDFYRAENPDLATIADPIRHYCEHGWREGRHPCPDFDTAHYLELSPDVRQAGMNPFLHFVTCGKAEGRRTRPAAAVPKREELLAQEIEVIRSSGQFDAAFYLGMNRDIQPPPEDPLRHFCERGWREGRDPSDEFSTNAYLSVYKDIRDWGVNPFWHYLFRGEAEFRQPRPGSGVRYEGDIWFGRIDSDVRLLAFHAEPDWETVCSRRVVVKGEDQALLPQDDVGFYDPAASQTLRQQAVQAARHGVRGFCFDLASAAFAALLDTPDIDIGLCPVVDPRMRASLDATDRLLRACQDPRAIRVGDLPVIVARPVGALVDACSELMELRRSLVDQKIGPVFLLACWTAGPRAALAEAWAVGACDAVLDLPDAPVPRESGGYEPGESAGVDTVPYPIVATQGVVRVRDAREAGFPLYQTIAVGRDNTGVGAAHRLVYRRFHVGDYRRWLDAALESARAIPDPGRRFVFLQSWNDWNQGQVLEPDRQDGFARLNETSRALLGLTRAPMPKVSVVVPNHNQEPFLRQRLDSIYAQTYTNIEVLLLDDGSSDGSRTVFDEYAAAYPQITRTVYNETHSGSAPAQWARGIKAATGDLLWVAKSDDWCDISFLEILVRSFADEAVLLAYGQSVFGDEAGSPLERPYVETAHREVRRSLGIRNTLPDAGAVVFRRPVALALLDDPAWLAMQTAADWVLYLHLVRSGKVAYVPAATNHYRRHDGSSLAASHGAAALVRDAGVACRTVAGLYDVPRDVLERCRDHQRSLPATMTDVSDQDFDEWFDFAAVLRAREGRLPNVMVCTMGFYPGGAEMFPIRVANELKRQGVSVLLLSTGLNPREDGVRRMLRNDVPLLETPDVEPVKDAIEQFGIEVLNTHQWHVQKYPVRVPDVFAGVRSHVATLHGMIEHGNAFAVTEEELRAADRNVRTWVYTADKNLGPFMDLGLVQGRESRFVKMPNGIQTPRIEAIPRAHLGIPQNAFVLCCVSRAIPDKGWAETIAAVDRARSLSGRDIRLVLVGNGPVYDQYRSSGVPDFVHLVGFSEDSAGHYACADMGIMLTRFRSESFPLTIVDCLFAGKPYIATDVGDIRNMLSTREGVAGEVIKLEDWQVPVEAAASAIAGFATNHEAYLAASALVPCIASRYSIERVATLYIDLFREALDVPPVSEAAAHAELLAGAA